MFAKLPTDLADLEARGDPNFLDLYRQGAALSLPGVVREAKQGPRNPER